MGTGGITASLLQLQPQEISPPPTANLDRSNDRVYENVTGLVKAVIEMSSKIQPAPPEEYVPMVKVKSSPPPVGMFLEPWRPQCPSESDQMLQKCVKAPRSDLVKSDRTAVPDPGARSSTGSNNHCSHSWSWVKKSSCKMASHKLMV